jgi:copper transport protein
MPRTLFHRFALVAFAAFSIVAIAVGLPAGTASAHNTMLGSDPADGASLATAPTQITWQFDLAVPLETMTVTLIDATGARSQLTGSVHGPAGDTEVVTPLPTLDAGPVSLRWRLVGPDGHPITGRVDFTITGAPSTTEPSTTAPATAADSPTTTIPTPGPESIAEADTGVFSTPSGLRWLLRYGSYLAILAAVGILLTSAWVWSDAGTHPVLRRILSTSLIATAVLAFTQALVVASDVSGKAPWASLGSIDAATTTDAGMAFMIRIALALTMWIVLFQYKLANSDVYWTAVSLPGIGLLATWAFAGHSRSMRWPAVGVATDVAHHAAAAGWIAGLAIVGWVAIPTTTPDVLVPVVRRFSQVAATCVAVLVITGVVQSIRLVGNPGALFDADHGRYLAIKVAILVAMLGIANANRRRVDARLHEPSDLPNHLGALRRAVVAEFAIGLVIIGVTAAMVVSPPATSTTAAAPPEPSTPVNYIL